MSQPWIIRAANSQDSLRVQQLFASHLADLGLQPDPDLDGDMTNLEETYTAPSGYFCVAVRADGLIAGMGGILEGMIRRVHVVPAARQQGLGRDLLEHLCNWASAHGLLKVRAVIARSNAPSQRLFSACGFSINKSAPPSAGGLTCELWERSLREGRRTH
jgi:GNAT superfamily N-acetyltransferase